VALARQHHAFWPAARTRSIEKHRRVSRLRRDRGERSAIDQRREIFLENKVPQIGRAQRLSDAVAQHEPCAAVAQDELDGCCRKLPIDRHRDETGSHDPEKGRQKLGAIGRQYRDALATAEAVRIGERVDLPIAVKSAVPGCRRGRSPPGRRDHQPGRSRHRDCRSSSGGRPSDCSLAEHDYGAELGASAETG
jgi:hypothetical protein